MLLAGIVSAEFWGSWKRNWWEICLGADALWTRSGPWRCDCAFRAKSKGGPSAPVDASSSIEPQTNETPEDSMRSAYEALKAAVVREVLDAVQAADPILLSQIMVKLLLAMGYGDKDSPDSGIVLDGVNDGGVDGVVNKDRLGLSRVYIQAKRYKDGNNVGAPAIQQFSGSMDERRANEGVS